MAFIKTDPFDSESAKSEGEKMLLKALGEGKDTAGWIVLHSLDILHNEFRTQGEADLVVLIPGLGVMVLEVKDSKSIERLSSGEWKIGGEVPRRGSPFKQASESMWNIRNYLDKKGVKTYGIPFVYGVWFTRVLASKFGDSIEWKNSQILGAEDLASDAAQQLKKKFKTLVGDRNADRSTSGELSKIAGILRPVVPLHADPADRQRLLNRHLEQALEQQKKLFALFGTINAYVVQGLAGTGKTYLAIAEAIKSHLRGEPALLLCYNKLLAADLQKRLLDYPHVKVANLHSLMMEVVGNEFPVQENQEFWTETLPQAAIEALMRSDELPRYQTVLIDEAQDIGQDAYLDFVDLFMYGGLAKSKVVLYGDFTNQAIFGSGQVALDVYKRRIPGLALPDALTINCRNTAQVGEFVAEFIEPEPPYTEFMRDDPTTGVNMHPVEPGVDIGGLVAQIVENERKQFPPNSIVILSSQKERLKQLLSSLPGKFRQFDERIDSACLYGSVQQFKGLEAASIILVEFEGGAGSVRDHFYIASTRATANFAFVVPSSQLAQISEKN